MQCLAYRIGDTLGQDRETANVANKKMISRALVKEVHTEARNLKKTATAEELAKLDFDAFKANDSRRCIYGQTTGECYSKRAEHLIQSCAKVVIASANVTFRGVGALSGTMQIAEPSAIHTERFWSPIEHYIASEGADNAQLIAFLKGERKTLNLYPTVNC